MAAHGPRLTEADRAAWDGFAQHIRKLSGRATPADAASPPNSGEGASTDPGARPTTRRATPAAKPRAVTAPLAIGDPPGGVDKSTWQRFRAGKLSAERKLDLHGMTAQRAFHALTFFLRAAYAEQIRCVEIVTGRGDPKASPRGTSARGTGEGTGVIRREFPEWLNRPDIRPLILGAAHPHVGTGAGSRDANQGAVRLLLRRVR
jgi:DNA-nicking Smr family endonuclease